jgi:hypothetical protein
MYKIKNKLLDVYGNMLRSLCATIHFDGEELEYVFTNCIAESRLSLFTKRSLYTENF